jgi:quinol monooxygenase YgiN
VIIVSGHLLVDPAERDEYLAGCVDVARLARAAPGCVDFHLSADPLEPGRINIFEQWASAEDAEAFRGDGPSDQQQAMVLHAVVEQHQIGDTISLT